jgi:hypothetical protein
MMNGTRARNTGRAKGYAPTRHQAQAATAVGLGDLVEELLDSTSVSLAVIVAQTARSWSASAAS